MVEPIDPVLAGKLDAYTAPALPEGFADRLVAAALADPESTGSDLPKLRRVPARRWLRGGVAGLGVIADFVGREPVRRRDFAGEGEQVARTIIVERGQLAFSHQRGEACPRLDSQLIKREMSGAEAQRVAQFCLPLRRRLARPGIDQIEADPAEMPLRHFQRGKAFRHRVEPAEEV